MNATPVSSSRRIHIDWLRVLLILAVFVFHSMRFFDLEDWHVKSASTYFGVQMVIVFISRWLMPTIFLISGAATFFALSKRGVGRFLRDRSLRLLVPLLVGLFTHVPVQGYLEAITHRQYSGSFWQYYAEQFNGLAGLGGNFNWGGNHLWYLDLLFVITLVCLPLLIWLRHGAGKRVLAWLGERLSRPGMVYLLVLPTLVVLLVLDPRLSWVLTDDTWGGWNVPCHMLFFLTGFVLASSPGMQAGIRRVRWISLAMGLVGFAIAGGLLVALGGEITFGTPEYALVQTFNSLCSWSLLLTILGFGLERLNVHTPLLDYANDAVMPFYVFHQSILVVVGFFVLGWAIPDFVKWLIIVPSSFVIIMALYELLVRRINLLRILFGMKPVTKEKAVQKPVVPVS